MKHEVKEKEFTRKAVLKATGLSEPGLTARQNRLGVKPRHYFKDGRTRSAYTQSQLDKLLTNEGGMVPLEEVVSATA